jgi:hypothetical protein
MRRNLNLTTNRQRECYFNSWNRYVLFALTIKLENRPLNNKLCRALRHYFLNIEQTKKRNKKVKKIKVIPNLEIHIYDTEMRQTEPI